MTHAGREDFDAAVGAHRRELLAHCYRMTGALGDAEDALQDGLVKAWRGLARFEGRSTLRGWLYRVVTSACLDLLAARRARSMPYLAAADGEVDDQTQPDLEPRWLEPFPDALVDEDVRPDARYARRESIRLAFVVAVQALPARQRANLMLRDVVAMSAEETAVALEISVTASNSLLQRARETLDDRRAQLPPPGPRAELDVLLARYVCAWELGDTAGLVALLREDAISSMPPNPLWLAGRAAIGAYMDRHVFSMGAIRLLPVAVNDAPAFAVYQQRGQGFGFMAISVLGVEPGGIGAIHSFLAIDPTLSPARYGLPAMLDS
jgi:RNA polymerase sigma-70 factor (ECF subfamily)